jgi:asparagine synthase (glutamine-hydrolysing)
MAVARPVQVAGGPVLKFFREPYRAAIRDSLEAARHRSRPQPSWYEYRKQMLLAQDNTDLAPLAVWGVELRDPTANRRLAEYCLRIPPEFLVKGQGRPAYDAAFGRIVDGSVTQPTGRGHQSANWQDAFRRADVERFAELHRADALLNELIDMDYLDTVIGAWPSARATSDQIAATYSQHVLSIMAAADFLRAVFPASGTTSPPDPGAPLL